MLQTHAWHVVLAPEAFAQGLEIQRTMTFPQPTAATAVAMPEVIPVENTMANALEQELVASEQEGMVLEEDLAVQASVVEVWAVVLEEVDVVVVVEVQE